MAVYIFLADGFEEVEALLPADLFYRAGIEVKLVGVVSGHFTEVSGAHNINVISSYSLDEVTITDMELLYLPGGITGTKVLAANNKLINIIKEQLMANKLIAAICAAPAYVLGAKGMLKGKNFTGSPGTEKLAIGGNYQPDQAIVQDENIITSQGVGTVAQFTYYLICLLRNVSVADKVWQATLFEKYLPKPLI